MDPKSRNVTSRSSQAKIKLSQLLTGGCWRGSKYCLFVEEFHSSNVLNLVSGKAINSFYTHKKFFYLKFPL